MIKLSSVARNVAARPPRIMVYASHGIGKTTFGAGAPDPIFILTEDGLGILDVPHFPLATSLDDVRQAITALVNEEHEYGTVVVDSLDWLDNLIWAEIHGKYVAADLAYGKGAVIAADIWREILSGFSALRDTKGMAVVLLAHCEIKRFDSPEVEPYDRYQPKLQARSSSLVQEWADAVLFANYKTIVKKTDVGFKKEVNRGITAGERLLYTTEKPAYLAKNRFGLPETLPFRWDALQAAMGAAINPAVEAA
jgi:AAA domain